MSIPYLRCELIDKYYIIDNVIQASGSFGKVFDIYNNPENTWNITKDYENMIVKRERNQKGKGINFTFLNEIYFHQHFESPYILRPLWYSVSKNHTYLCFEKKPENLEEWSEKHLKDKKRKKKISVITQQLFSIVRNIHENSWAHLDLKVENILIDDHTNNPNDLKIYLIDFGFSNRFPIFPQQCCCLINRPPEMISSQSEKFDAIAVDIWSFGCSIAEIVYCDMFFKPDNFDEDHGRSKQILKCILETLQKDTKESKKKFSKLKSKCEKWVYDLLLICFQLDPKIRKKEFHNDKLLEKKNIYDKILPVYTQTHSFHTDLKLDPEFKKYWKKICKEKNYPYDIIYDVPFYTAIIAPKVIVFGDDINKSSNSESLHKADSDNGRSLKSKENNDSNDNKMWIFLIALVYIEIKRKCMFLLDDDIPKNKSHGEIITSSNSDISLYDFATLFDVDYHTLHKAEYKIISRIFDYM